MKVIIDGKTIVAEGKKTILDVARENGISIPSLCDHSQLIPFTGCRLCLVQIKGRRGYLPSCSTLVQEGMEVKTSTPRLRKLRAKILELILTEHPHACLICAEKENCDEFKSTIRKVGETTGCVLCPNNGRCQLQDVVEEIKLSKVNFPAVYRDLEIKKQDPFFDRNYNLCILCGRCVRICHEVRGLSTIAFIRRGSETVVSTALDKSLIDSNCQFCGACVDVCPTGALTEKAAKYLSLPDKKTSLICPFCSTGCVLDVNLHDGKIVSSQPSAEGAVNKGQACVRGRFTLRDVLYDSQRLTQPLIKRKGKLEEASWEEALEIVAGKLKKYSSREVAVMSSPQAFCESGYVLRKFASQVLKTANISSASCAAPYPAYQDLFRKEKIMPSLNYKVENISHSDTIFLVGSNLSQSSPIVWLKVFQAVKKGAKLIVASPEKSLYDPHTSVHLQHHPGEEGTLINYLSRLFADEDAVSHNLLSSPQEGRDAFLKRLKSLTLSELEMRTGLSKEKLQQAYDIFTQAKSISVLFGFEAVPGSVGKRNLSALWNFSLLTGAQLYPLSLESNARGIFEIERHFSSQVKCPDQWDQGMIDQQIKALFLTGPYPLPKKAKPEFLVVLDCFENETAQKADVILPAAAFAETEGVFVNMEGRVQLSERITISPGDARPDWWIIAQIAQQMGNSEFPYKKSSDIFREMRKTIPAFSHVSYPALAKGKEVFVKETKAGKKKYILQKPSIQVEEPAKKYPFQLVLHYNLDYYRGLALSNALPGFQVFRDAHRIRICPEDAEKLGLDSGDSLEVLSPYGKIKGRARISNTVNPGLASVALVNPWYHNGRCLNVLPVKIKRGKE